MVGARAVSMRGLVVVGCVAAGSRLVAQDDPGTEESLAAERLEAMRAQIQSIAVFERDGDDAIQAELRPEPVFRYSDNVRQFADASAWLWRVAGRPVAFCKLERIVGAEVEGWQYCFVSLSDRLTTAHWSDRFEWRARKPGLTWSPVPQARPARASESGRLSQMRQMARRFEATILNPAMERSEKMRLLSTPLARYAAEAQGVTDGALFGLASQGTNPDALLLIELVQRDGGDQWRYALAGATGDAVEVRLGGTLVWSHPYTGVPGDYENWMWIAFWDNGSVSP
jgi:hypothetical protein